MGFQTTVNQQPAPAVTGDFASQNPRATLYAAAGQLVAPAGGLIVGNFAFVNPTTGAVSNAYASGDLIGFLARESQGLITVFLEDSSLVVPEGFMVTLYTEGDFWATFAAAGTAGAPIYANETTGAPQVSSTGGVATGFTLANSPGAGELGYMSSWKVTG